MTSCEEFSLASAQRAADESTLAEWVVDFLASPGSDNGELAAALAFSGAAYLGPIRFELDRLTPMAGPDEGRVAVPVPKEDWESDVEAMEHSIEEGWRPPPLLVSLRNGNYYLEDGNHRYETLCRSGATHAWTILLFANEAERDQFLKGHNRMSERLGTDAAIQPPRTGTSGTTS
jgi:ParB-like nuclease domain